MTNPSLSESDKSQEGGKITDADLLRLGMRLFYRSCPVHFREITKDMQHCTCDGRIPPALAAHVGGHHDSER